MLLAAPRRVADALATGRDPAITIDQISALHGRAARQSASDVALVLTDAFDVAPGGRASLQIETRALSERAEVDACLVRVAGEPAATARVTTFDGASYLSSIGTRPAFRSRGLGRLATATVAADAVAAGSRWTYLGVHADNEPAIGLYRDLGFEPIGEPAPDLLLR